MCKQLPTPFIRSFLRNLAAVGRHPGGMKACIHYLNTNQLNCQMLLCLQRKNCAAKQQSVLTSDAGQQTSDPSDEVKASTTNGEAAPVDGEPDTGSRSNSEDEEEGNNSGKLAHF